MRMICGRASRERPHGPARSLVLLLTALALALALRGAASAAPLVYEPFTYDAGTVLDGVAATGQNLTGTYQALGPSPAQQLVVEAPGLGFGSLTGTPTASGGRVADVLGITPAGATVSVAQPVDVGPGEAIYWSALLTFDDSANGNHLANITLTDTNTGDQLFFGEPSVGVRALRVAADTQATGELVADSADGAFSDGQTLFLIGRYGNGASPATDTLDLVGYDVADAVALPSAFDPLDPNAAVAFALAGLDIDLVRIDAITFTIRGVDDNFIDELRIGSTYADVVPEPTPGALLLASLAGLAGWRRFHACR